MRMGHHADQHLYLVEFPRLPVDPFKYFASVVELELLTGLVAQDQRQVSTADLPGQVGINWLEP